MKIAVIPARGGSKRIPRKNIRYFLGRPIIGYSIEAALRSRCFDAVVVSTDDAEIATVARQYGAVTPFERPSSLSDDHTPTASVVRHALQWYRSEGIGVSAVCCIYATAPFLTSKLLCRGWEALQSSGCAYSLSVTQYPFPIQRAVTLNSGARLQMLQPQFESTRSQDLPAVFHDAGQFYWGTVEAYQQQLPIFAPHSVGVVVPRAEVQDIDTFEDWAIAETLYRSLGRDPAKEG